MSNNSINQKLDRLILLIEGKPSTEDLFFQRQRLGQYEIKCEIHYPHHHPMLWVHFQRVTFVFAEYLQKEASKEASVLDEEIVADTVKSNVLLETIPIATKMML